eukprot:SAG11_NODE_1669_length_4489_cov_4.583371_2_plen_200_part_00
MVDYSSGRDSVEIRLDEHPRPAATLGRTASRPDDVALAGGAPRASRLMGGVGWGYLEDGNRRYWFLTVVFCGVFLFPLVLAISMLIGYVDMNDDGSMLEAKATCRNAHVATKLSELETQIVGTEDLSDALNCMKILAILMITSLCISILSAAGEYGISRLVSGAYYSRAAVQSAEMKVAVYEMSATCACVGIAITKFIL